VLELIFAWIFPMREERSAVMQISVEVSSEVQNEAATRGVPVYTFVEMLMERGLESMRDRSSVANAVDRIRALRKPEIAGRLG
jgi:hypothetical protein